MKKMLTIALLACLFVLLQPSMGHAEEAKELPARVTAWEDGRTWNSSSLRDGNYNTKLSFNGTGEVVVETDEDMRGLYLVWDSVPGPWLLKAESDGTSRGLLCGQSGFLHEYVALDEPSKKVSVCMPKEGTILCDVFAYGEGELPSDVQVWQNPCEDADMLLISTHADDEHLFFGGTMPTYAGELGYDVQIAYLTHHWAEPYRPHELLNGLWTVGMTHYPIISTFTDYYSDNLEHAKTLWDLNEVEAYEVMLLRRFKPEVVIDHDVNGEYGHGAHRLNTWVLQQAIEWAADPAWRAGEAAESGSYLAQAQALPAFGVQKVYLHLWPENAVRMNWDKPLSHFGGRTAFEMAGAGFACHRSQQQWFSMGRTGVFDSAAFGLYYTAVGPDEKTEDADFFEHVVWASGEPADGASESAEPAETLPEPAGEAPEEAQPADKDQGHSPDETFPELLWRRYKAFILGAIGGIAVVAAVVMLGGKKRYKGKH
ncbi:MAG: PIG-L family deacetylase [Clostridia bacterium]|nr:PIG-L family deacetylase [Clostridia bacterium]